MRTKQGRQSKKSENVFNFTDTKCPLPMELDRYRVTITATKELAMAVPVYQDGMLLFKVKTPLAKKWSEHFKEELELNLFYYDGTISAKWNSL